MLPAELILTISDFLPDKSLSPLIQTQKCLACLLTPCLYKRLFRTGFDHHWDWHLRFVDRWKSQIILDFSRKSPAHLFINDNCGGYLLHVAARKGNFTLIEILLSKGVDINFYTSEITRTALDAALNFRNEAMVLWLLEFGAYPIHELAYGPERRWVDYNIRSIDALAGGFRCWPTIVQNIIENLQKRETRCSPKLFDDGSALMVPTAQLVKDEALKYAVFKGIEPLVRLFLDCGGDPLSTMTDHYEKASALGMAVYTENESIFHMLLDHLLLDRSCDGPRRIHHALEFANSVLVTRKSSVFTGGKENVYLFHQVVDAGWDLKNWPCPKEYPSALYYLASHGCVDAVKFWIEHGADVYEVPGAQGIPLLQFTIGNSRTPIAWQREATCLTIMKVIKNDLRKFNHTVPSLGGYPWEGGTSLHLAVKYRLPILVQLLVDTGVDTEVKDVIGRRAIDLLLGGEGSQEVQIAETISGSFHIPEWYLATIGW